MGLETAQNISELNVNWPLGTDPVSQGDDHVRLIKDVLANVFPGNTAPGTFGVDFTLDPYGIAVRWATVSEDLRVDRQILGSPQVAVGLATVNGLTGAFTGPNEGINAVTREAAGTYDVQLADTQWNTIDDLQLCGDVEFGLAGVGAMVMRNPVGAGHSTATGWVSITTQVVAGNNITVADCVTFSPVIFDSGRD